MVSVSSGRLLPKAFQVQQAYRGARLDSGGDDTRKADEPRDPDLFFVHVDAVLHVGVIHQTLTVVGCDDHERVVCQVEFVEGVQQSAELEVGVGDLLIVGGDLALQGRRVVSAEPTRVRIRWDIRGVWIVVVNEEEERRAAALKFEPSARAGGRDCCTTIEAALDVQCFLPFSCVLSFCITCKITQFNSL